MAKGRNENAYTVYWIILVGPDSSDISEVGCVGIFCED